MLVSIDYRSQFERAKPFADYVRTAKAHEAEGWNAFHARVTLTQAQRALVAGITRRVNILCISGTWCGDCVQQVPILARIEEANPADRAHPDAPGIDLRIVDRDEHIDLSDAHRLCGGNRVPVMIFLTELFDLAAVAGDRTLSRYRALLARQMGPACLLPGAPIPADELGASVQDWLNEVERVAIMLRLSGKLRQKHGD